MSPIKRPSTENEAALYDSVVVPRWSARFGQLILRSIPTGLRAQVLDLGCGTGHPAFSLVEHLDARSRVIAIDADSALVDIARRRAMALPHGHIFFKVAQAEELGFGDGVFDLVVGNLVLAEMREPLDALLEIRRVLAPGGRVVLTRPLAGTFGEIHDMYREIAAERGDDALLARLEETAGRYPDASGLAAPLRTAGFTDIAVEQEVFRLSFHNARELFRDDLVRFVGLAEWRWIAGLQEGGEALLGEVERRLDVYFGHGPLSLTIVAGMVTARPRR